MVERFAWNNGEVGEELMDGYQVRTQEKMNMKEWVLAWIKFHSSTANQNPNVRDAPHLLQTQSSKNA